VSPEMYRYVDKLLDYISIQNIEREFSSNAADANINRDIIMPPETKSIYFPTQAGPIDVLGNLYFEPATMIPLYTRDTINTSTFNAYRYYEEEIRLITYLIKRLFIQHPVWTYDDLWAAVKRPPVNIEVNPAFFNENNFIIALNNLINISTTVISAVKQKTEITESMLVEKLFDPAQRHIYKNGQRYKIEQIDRYYILFPIIDMPANPLNMIYAEYVEYIRDKERTMIKELPEPNDRINIDVETYLRRMHKHAGMRINLNTFMNRTHVNINYVRTRGQFVKNHAGGDIFDFLSDYSAPFQTAFIEEAIIYGILQANKQSVGAQLQSVDAQLQSAYEKIIGLLDKFRIIIYPHEVLKYKDTSKQYKNGLPDISEKTPLGYTTTKSVRLYDPNTEENGKLGKWLEISKIALNRHIAYKENDVIIGQLEPIGETIKFKLRKPIHKIREDMSHDMQKRKEFLSNREGKSANRIITSDTRLIERGIVCNTKNKYDLLKIIASLGISVSNMDRSEVRIKHLCRTIKHRLMDNEIRERQKDSKLKYMYFWWDENVALSSII
jgi:hypothetical protein